MCRRTLALFAALLGLTIMMPAHAQWKWRDGKGQTQYSDLPPPQGVAEQDILSRPQGGRSRTSPQSPTASAAAASASSAAVPAASAVASNAVKTVDPELEAKRKKAEAEQAAKLKAEEAKLASARADNCVRAKSQLQSLEGGMRIMRTNERGEREFLDDKQRADETRRTREMIASDCK